MASRWDAVPRRAVLARAGAASRRSSRPTCSGSFERQLPRRSPRSTWPAPMPARSASSAAGDRPPHTSRRCELRCLPSNACSSTVATTRAARRSAASTTARRPARPGRPAVCDIVVTATTSDEPVLHGEWLCDGAFVCAVGANAPASRELDDDVLLRAAFVCTDARAQAQVEAGDLIDPVGRGVLTGRRCTSFRTSSRAGCRAGRATKRSRCSSRTGSPPGTSPQRRASSSSRGRLRATLPSHRRRRPRRAHAPRRAGRGAVGSAPGVHRFVT